MTLTNQLLLITEINFYSNLEASVEIISDSSSQSAYLNIISVTPPYSILARYMAQFSENIPIGSSNVTLIDNRIVFMIHLL